MREKRRAASASSANFLEELARPGRLLNHGPAIARVLLSIRLQALYERQCEDPLPDLAVRLESVTLAGLVLDFTCCAKRIWPEPIHVGRMCCQLLSHDEASIAAVLAKARSGDRAGFDHELDGLVRADRRGAFWDLALRIAPWL